MVTPIASGFGTWLYLLLSTRIASMRHRMRQRGSPVIGRAYNIPRPALSVRTRLGR
jgi:hypothetical protein